MKTKHIFDDTNEYNEYVNYFVSNFLVRNTNNHSIVLLLLLLFYVPNRKRWILMPPEMGKYLKPSRVPYEESSCYSKINFSCPDNIKSKLLLDKMLL